MKLYPEDFDNIVEAITYQLYHAPVVEVGEWQAIQNKDMPQAKTIEIEDVSFKIKLPQEMVVLQSIIQPNLPWAEDHFQERVSGIPHNPPPSSAWWPFAQRNNDQFKQEEKFSHTYPERMWPKWVGTGNLGSNFGLRYQYGDLDDVVRLLRSRPGTRQAYLPIWFPEDTGAVEGQRVPCTLGYHFLVRSGGLKTVYYIRSCDFYRHFRDDVYMAARLGQWVAEKIGVRVDTLVMHISSMHVFEPERGRLETELGQIRYANSAVPR
jgi:hypothetical protein